MYAAWAMEIDSKLGAINCEPSNIYTVIFIIDPGTQLQIYGYIYILRSSINYQPTATQYG